MTQVELLNGSWVTDDGLETDLIFNHGVDLPEFAAFPLVHNAEGRTLLDVMEELDAALWGVDSSR